MNYPPTARWKDLSQTQRVERLETSEELRRLLQWHRGDPRATRWEEEFLTSIVWRIDSFHGAARLTTKQWDVVWKLLDKFGADFPGDELAADFPGDKFAADFPGDELAAD